MKINYDSFLHRLNTNWHNITKVIPLSKMSGWMSGINIPQLWTTTSKKCPSLLQLNGTSKNGNLLLALLSLIFLSLVLRFLIIIRRKLYLLVVNKFNVFCPLSFLTRAAKKKGFVKRSWPFCLCILLWYRSS